MYRNSNNIGARRSLFFWKGIGAESEYSNLVLLCYLSTLQANWKLHVGLHANFNNWFQILPPYFLAVIGKRELCDLFARRCLALHESAFEIGIGER